MQPQPGRMLSKRRRFAVLSKRGINHKRKAMKWNPLNKPRIPGTIEMRAAFKKPRTPGFRELIVTKA